MSAILGLGLPISATRGPNPPGERLDKSPCGSRINTHRLGTGGLPDRCRTAVCEVSSTVRTGMVDERIQRRQPLAF